jgi:L-threonylcarbamoyladenylate synthase
LSAGLPTRDAIAGAAAALRRGQLVVIPTETVYGLGADAADGEAVARIFEAKGRPRFNPLISHVADIAAATALIRMEGAAVALAEAFWPGPLTLVAPAAPGCPVSDLARAGLDTVAVRVPGHPVALALLRAFGGPVAAPSANRSGRPSPTTLEHAMAEVGHAVAVGLEGGPCEVGLESTVVSVTPQGVALLRPGGVTREALQAIIGPLAVIEEDRIRSPGRLALHYAPQAPVRLNADAPRPGEAFLAFGPTPAGPGIWNLSPTGDLRQAAARLFAYLRAADRTAPAAIAVAPIPPEGLGEAINDRLKRAAGYVG